MKKEDFDKILKNMEKFDVDKKGNVTPKPNVQDPVTPERARVVRLSYALFAACKQKLFSDENITIEYARTMYEQMLPFFNDFEKMIKDNFMSINRNPFKPQSVQETASRHYSSISASEISSLFEKHQEDCKHFYDIVEPIFLTPSRIKPFVEHALGKDVNEINFNFHEDKSKGVAYQNRIEQTDIIFK